MRVICSYACYGGREIVRIQYWYKSGAGGGEMCFTSGSYKKQFLIHLQPRGNCLKGFPNCSKKKFPSIGEKIIPSLFIVCFATISSQNITVHILYIFAAQLISVKKKKKNITLCKRVLQKYLISNKTLSILVLFRFIYIQG